MPTTLSLSFRTVAFAFLVLAVLVQPLAGLTPADAAAYLDFPNPATLEDRYNYLPVIFKNHPRPWSIFGIETYNMSSTSQDKIDQAGAYWLRHTSFDWSKIESTRTDPPSYSWTSVNELGMELASVRGLQMIGIIKNTPTWARKYSGWICSPPAPEYLDELAQFVRAVVTRYSQSPFNIHYWELGNEVDVAPHLVVKDSPFGCWGDADSPTYGGEYYAEMLKVVYPVIKAADPAAQVLIGGLLLDCDPTQPGKETRCLPARFLEGILKNGGGSYFDLLSFHSYAYYYPGRIAEDVEAWQARGGQFYGKINFIQEVQAAYSVSKPLIMTEISLLWCQEGTPGCPLITPDFLEKQANYVVWSYVRSWAAGLQAAVWYTFEENGWRSSGLSTRDGPKPALFAFDYAAHKLEGATLLGPVTSLPEMTGYEFWLPGKLLWIVWSTNQSDQVVTLPDKVSAIYDLYGNVIQLTNPITINRPTYIEIAP